MSDIRPNRINLLNKDCFRTTSALTGIFSVLGKSSMGVTCAEPTAIEPRRSLRDLVVGHTQDRTRRVGSVANPSVGLGARR
jgi:hypothetical protein